MKSTALALLFATVTALGVLFDGAATRASALPPLIDTLSPILSYDSLRDFRTGQRNVFVGRINGTDAFIGVKIRGDEVLVYICDGKTVWRWLEGTLEDGKAELASRGVRVQLTASNNAVAGTVTLGDDEHSFRAIPATSPGAGLFRSEEKEPLGGKLVYRGWIFLPNGQFRGDVRRLSPNCQLALDSIKALGKIELKELDEYKIWADHWIENKCG